MNKEPYKVHADLNKPLGNQQEQNMNGKTPILQRMKAEWNNNRKGVLQTAAVVTVAVAAVGITVYLLRRKSLMNMIRNSGVVSAGLALSQKVMDTAQEVTHKVVDKASEVTHNLLDNAGVMQHQVADTACNVTGKLKAEMLN